MTDDKSEREHCKQALARVRDLDDWLWSADVLFNERAAADLAGYERGRAHNREERAVWQQANRELSDGLTALQSKYDADVKAAYERGRAEGTAAYQNLVDQEVGQAMDCAAHERAARAEGYDAGVRFWQSLCKCADLQSRYDTLAAAAREFRRMVNIHSDASASSFWPLMEDTLDAALASEPLATDTTDK